MWQHTLFTSLLPKMRLPATPPARSPSQTIATLLPQYKRLSPAPLWKWGWVRTKANANHSTWFYLLWVPCCRLYHTSKSQVSNQIVFMHFFLHAFPTLSPFIFPQGDFSPHWPFKRQFKCSLVHVKSLREVVKIYILNSKKMLHSLLWSCPYFLLPSLRENTLSRPVMYCVHLCLHKR